MALGKERAHADDRSYLENYYMLHRTQLAQAEHWLLFILLIFSRVI